MTAINDKLAAKIANAAKTGPDMTQATKGGGGEYTLPEAGVARARFVGYFEIGEHEKDFQGKKSWKPAVELVFELSGPKHPPIKTADGDEFPQRMTIREWYGTNEKSHFFKIFQQMNYANKATHIAQLLGEAFLVKIVHFESDFKGKKVKRASLKAKGVGYTITGPRVQDPLSGEFIDVPVDPPRTEIKAFLWDLADMDDWKALFIPGEYPERKDEKTGEVISPARSKNVIQERIMKARNWPKHPIYAALRAAGGNVEAAEQAQQDLDDAIGDAEQPEVDEGAREANDAARAAGDDPLAGIA